MKEEYLRPGVLLVSTAADAGAKLSADMAAQSQPSNETSGISWIVGEDDGISDMVTPRNTSLGNVTGRINVADPVNATPSLP